MAPLFALSSLRFAVKHMPPRSTINQLPGEQFQFIDAINRGQSDREICIDFEAQFGHSLSKGSLDI
jgi:hypothetical protein